jgi:hypothetical protein
VRRRSRGQYERLSIITALCSGASPAGHLAASNACDTWPAVVVLGITAIPIIDLVVNRRFAKKERMRCSKLEHLFSG